MEYHMVAKDRPWIIEAFEGLAFNELLAREYIKARMTGNAFSLDQFYKVMRKSLK